MNVAILDPATLDRLMAGFVLDDPPETVDARPIHHDRAAVIATALIQIFETAPADQWRQGIEDYLRDEFADAPTDLPF